MGFDIRLLNSDDETLDFVGSFGGSAPAAVKKLDGALAGTFTVDFSDISAWEKLSEAERKLAASAVTRPGAIIKVVSTESE